ncbi:MAG: DUF2914 domain-containing protein [Acidiferrobacterales bacterium]
MKAFLFAITGALIATQLHAAELRAAAMRTDVAAATAGHSQLMSGRVAHATLTTAVVDREPVDSISTLSNQVSQLYYFTEIQGMAGQTVTHRWEYNGKIMADVSFDIGGPRWRVYSSKKLQPGWLGDWKVSVVDAAGNALSVDTFFYTGDAVPSRAAAFSDTRTP